MQVFVMRVNLAKTLDDFLEESAFDSTNQRPLSNLQLLTGGRALHWSGPKHSLVDDVTLFQVSAGACGRANSLERQAADYGLAGSDLQMLTDTIDLARRYAGCIISTAQVSGVGETLGEGGHWKARYYVPLENVHFLTVPMRIIGVSPYKQWPEFQPYGPVLYRQFSSQRRYRTLIDRIQAAGNSLPSYVRLAKLTSADQVKPTRNNWIQVAGAADHGYPSEASLRFMFSDWLLRELSDHRKLLTEVTTVGPGGQKGRVDNVILVDGVPVPVEVKLRVGASPGVLDQMERYRQATTMTSGTRRLKNREHDIVLLVDQDGLYITDGSTHELGRPDLARRGLTEKKVIHLRRKLERLITSSR